MCPIGEHGLSSSSSSAAGCRGTATVMTWSTKLTAYVARARGNKHARPSKTKYVIELGLHLKGWIGRHGVVRFASTRPREIENHNHPTTTLAEAHLLPKQPEWCKTQQRVWLDMRGARPSVPRAPGSGYGRRQGVKEHQPTCSLLPARAPRAWA